MSLSSVDEIMMQGVNRARLTMTQNIGGPFGAVITKDDEIIAIASNTVLGSCDPTAHAEVNAIRHAGKVLGTHDLSDCVLYCSGAPCPMCMSAIIWSNIKKVYYSGSYEDAAEIGFRDEFIYNFIRGGCADKEVLDLEQSSDAPAKMLYQEYVKMNKQIY